MTAWKTNNGILASLTALWVAPGTLMDARAQEPLRLTNAVSMPRFNLELERKRIWENGIGEGFRREAQSIGLSAGANYGFATFGSREAHDLALVTLSYGHMLGRTWAEGHWRPSNPLVLSR